MKCLRSNQKLCQNVFCSQKYIVLAKQNGKINTYTYQHSKHKQVNQCKYNHCKCNNKLNNDSAKTGKTAIHPLLLFVSILAQT